MFIERHQISAVDISNQTLTGSKELGNSVCDIFKYFWKTNE